MKAQFATLLLLISGSLHAASLEPKNGVNLLYIGGAEVEEHRDINKIEPGKIQVILNYNKKLKGSGKDRVFDSSPYVVSFDAPDTDIVITPPKMYTYDQAAQAFKNNPQWKIETVTGKSVAYTQEALDQTGGFMPFFDMSERVAKHNAARGITFGASTAIATKAQIADLPKAEPKVTTSITKTVKSEMVNLEQLKAWYVKATPEERKEFRRWIIDQE
ncbi:DUF2057 family protein [Vibrio sp. TRT 21S02]|uniref:YccT family protein n=1 Tax=Vibrio sp. TRT 21S02 TaxID=3418507 RepID=UPI003CEA8459